MVDGGTGPGTGTGASDDPVDLDALFAQWRDEFAELDAEAGGEGGEGDGEDWVPLAVAEERAKVSRSTLRAWYRSGRIPSRLDPGPHGMQRLVPLSAVLDRASRSPRSGRGDGAPPAPKPSSDVVRLAELAVEEARRRAEAAEFRAEGAEAALRAALERAAAAEAEVRLLRGNAP